METEIRKITDSESVVHMGESGKRESVSAEKIRILGF